jgi:hypothetical protein
VKVIVGEELAFVGELRAMRPILPKAALTGSPIPGKIVEGKSVFSWDYFGDDGTMRFRVLDHDFALPHRHEGYGFDELVDELNRQGGGRVLWRRGDGDPYLLLYRRAEGA